MSYFVASSLARLGGFGRRNGDFHFYFTIRRRDLRWECDCAA